MVAIVVSDDRLVLQKLTRRFEPDGEPLPLTRADIAEAKGSGGGGAGASVGALLMDEVATQLVIKTTAGEKLKLRMMDGGAGTFGSLGGGEFQGQGVRALGEWFERNV
jgi:hypothetical protein